MGKAVRVIVMLIAMVALACAVVGCASLLPAGNTESSSPQTSNAADGQGSQDEGSAQEASAAENTANQAAATDSSGDPNAAKVKEPLKVGVDLKNSPFTFQTDSGEIVGLDVDLAYLTCQDLGWELQIVPMSWSDKDILLEQGDIDCVWSSFTMEYRDGLYAMSIPYYESCQVVLVKKDSAIDSKASLRDKSVSVQSGSLALDVLKSHSGGQASLDSMLLSMRVVADVSVTLPQLDAGEIDAIVCEDVLAEQLMNEYPDAYRIAMSLYSEHYVVAFKNGDEDKAAAVSEALTRINRRGVMDELCRKYAAYGVNYQSNAL